MENRTFGRPIGPAKKAESAEALMALAKENGIEQTEEDARKYFAARNSVVELSDDEMSSVAGGYYPQEYRDKSQVKRVYP